MNDTTNQALNERAERARACFCAGHNCAQAVLMAYADLAGLDEGHAALLAAGLGGGIGRLRETCGAFSACALLAGAIEGEDAGESDKRVDVYLRVQRMADAFIARHGSVCCGTILGRTREVPVPEKRTPEYYASRPCLRVILSACEILDAELAGKAQTDL